MYKKIKVAVLGSTGYTGLELINLLNNHPHVSINFLSSFSNSGKNINTFDKRLNDSNLPILDKLENLIFENQDVIFLALPHGESQKIISKFYDKTKFIDLSADFRINDHKIYEKNYKVKHLTPFLSKNFVYGLPEYNYESIKNSNNIAVPGCYPTSILLPLIPLIKKNLINNQYILIDSKSGYSGAGKDFDISKLINNNILNFYNYNTNNHRHICEIKQELEIFTKEEIKFSFNPHILPNFRGLMSTIYCELNKNIDKNSIYENLLEYYSKSNFVKILKDNDKADIFSVINTNNCLIKLYNHFSDDKIIIVSIIDNLVKGASGQAVQCMNIMFNLNESSGLIDIKSE